VQTVCYWRHFPIFRAISVAIAVTWEHGPDCGIHATFPQQQPAAAVTSFGRPIGRRWLDGDIAATTQYFSAEGSIGPQIHWSPVLDDLAAVALRFQLSFYPLPRKLPMWPVKMGD
jgi:hypothetical protein